MQEMKLKTKLLVALLVVLATICVCGTVKATDEVFTEDDEYIQNILNAIPDSMDLDIKESEYEKAQSLVEKNVNEAFASKQIDTSKVEIDVNTNGINYTLLDDINNFYKANVRITYLGVNGTEEIEKEINIKYNNTDNHNQADKEYIDSLSFVNKDYFAIDFEDWKKIANNGEAYQEYIWTLVEDYYTKQINDDSVQDLEKYADESFYKEHPNIRFTTVGDDSEYEVMAVFYSRVYYKNETNVFRYYYFINAENEEEYNEFVQNAKESSIYDTGITAEYGDQLLTLSTCDYSQENGRFAVVAKKIE